jgi:hypothetical protein
VADLSTIELDPFELMAGLLTKVGSNVVRWGGSTSWSRLDSLERLLDRIDEGGTFVAERPGEFARSETAPPPKRRWNQPIVGPHSAVGYLFYPYGAPKRAVAAFAASTISPIDAARTAALPLCEVIARAERHELGGVKIQGRWFLSHKDVRRKAERAGPSDRSCSRTSSSAYPNPPTLTSRSSHEYHDYPPFRKY